MQAPFLSGSATHTESAIWPHAVAWVLTDRYRYCRGF